MTQQHWAPTPAPKKLFPIHHSTIRMSHGQCHFAMNDDSERPTKRNKHIDERHFFRRQEKIAGNVECACAMTRCCPPKIATKNLLSREEACATMLDIECPLSDEAIGPKAFTRSPKETRRDSQSSHSTKSSTHWTIKLSCFSACVVFCTIFRMLMDCVTRIMFHDSNISLPSDKRESRSLLTAPKAPLTGQ